MVFIVVLYASILHSCYVQEFSFFPLSQYMNDTKLNNSAQFLCQQQDSNLKLCNCDDACFASKTCCIDKLWNNTNPLPINVYLEMLVKKSKTYRDMVCEQLIPIAIGSGHKSDKIFMVNSCQESANMGDTKMCANNDAKNYTENIPVIGFDKRIYRNANCAFCNSIKFNEVNLTLRCQDETETEKLEKKITAVEITEILKRYKNCTVSLFQSTNINDHIYSCFSPEDEEMEDDEICPSSNNYYDLCNAYSGTFFHYKNYDCFRCIQNERVVQDVVPLNCNMTTYLELGGGDDYLAETVSLIKSETPAVNCGNGLFYSQLTFSCEPVNCCYGYSIVGSQCLDLQNKVPTKFVENASFEKCLFNVNPGFYAITDNFVNVEELDGISSETNIRTCRPIKTQILQNSVLFQCNASVNTAVLKSLEQNKYLSYKNMSLFMTSVHYQIYTDFYGLNFIRSFKDNKLCAQLEEITNLEGNFTNSCDYITTDRVIKNEDLILWIEVNNGVTTKKMTTCKQFHLKFNCILRWLITNYTLQKEVLTYRYSNAEYKFTADQFVPLSKGLGVCESSFLKSEKHSRLKYYVNLMCVILICVSIGCYVFIFTTYTYFKELRVISNFNIITLCAILTLSDSLILLAILENKNKILCECVSIVLHWSLLAAYTWILCMAIELTLKFSKFAPKLFSHKRFFTSNIIVSFMIPTMIVAVTCALEYTGAVYVGYGKNDHCWINGFYARVFSYILPLSVILVSSGLCLLLTIYNIKKVEGKNKKLLGSGRTSNVNLVMITVKLILILGVPDALAFVQISKTSLSEWEVIFNSVFTTIYICWRSSKGIMLFMVYICNKNVFKIYKKSYNELNAKEASKTESTKQKYHTSKESDCLTQTTL